MPWYTPTSTNQMPTGFSEESLTPRSEAWPAGIREGLDHTLPGLAYWAGRRVRGEMDDPSVITQAEAQRRAEAAGVQVNFPEDGISNGAATAMIERAYGRKRRQTLMDTSNMIGAGKFTAEFIGGVADPVNLLFLPLGLPAAGAKAGFGAFATRAAFGALEGAAVTAAAEPAYNLLSNYVGDDYGMADSLMNIAMGGALGGAFHLGGALISHVGERRAAGRKALAQILADADEPVNVDAEVRQVFGRRPNGSLADTRTADAWMGLHDFAEAMEAAKESIPMAGADAVPGGPSSRLIDWGSIREEAAKILEFEPNAQRLDERPREPALVDEAGRPLMPPEPPNYSRLAEIMQAIAAFRAENPNVKIPVQLEALPSELDWSFIAREADDVARALDPTPAVSTEPGLSPIYKTPDVSAEIKNVDTIAAEVTKPTTTTVEPGEPDPELNELATEDIRVAKELSKAMDREDPLKRELSAIDEDEKEVNSFIDSFASALRCALRKGTP